MSFRGDAASPLGSPCIVQGLEVGRRGQRLALFNKPAISSRGQPPDSTRSGAPHLIPPKSPPPAQPCVGKYPLNCKRVHPSQIKRSHMHKESTHGCVLTIGPKDVLSERNK
ncbi:hypothetical protein AOLI_G00152060 [Acnodon oligacanthus]